MFRILRQNKLDKLVAALFIFLVVVYFQAEQVPDQPRKSIDILGNNVVREEEQSIEEKNDHSNNYIRNQIYNDNGLNKLYMSQLNNLNLKDVAENKIKNIRKRNESRINKKNYIVLEYTRIFGSTKYCQQKIIKPKNLIGKSPIVNSLINQSLKFKDEYTILDKCLFNNCYFTCDQSYSAIVDAVLFHETDLIQNINKADKDSSVNIVPSRVQDQIWILWNDEANIVDRRLNSYKFNWTISYKKTAEISYGAYGLLTNSQVFDKFEMNTFENNIRQEFQARANKAVWFVSNCGSRQRIKFASSIGLLLFRKFQNYGPYVTGLRIQYLISKSDIPRIQPKPNPWGYYLGASV
jgi:hypothetical protein